ncbi:Uncharacterised protein [Chlamydia trachomatis]|nr:Uncharacterised protein [Chlamydia trachomatis]
MGAKIQQPQGFITQLRSTNTIHDATKKSEEQDKTFVSLNSDIEAAIKKIETAFLDKAVADYNTALDEEKTIIESLAALISDTDGKVLNDAIRQEASAALADAQKTIEETVDTKNLGAVKKATTPTNNNSNNQKPPTQLATRIATSTVIIHNQLLLVLNDGTTPVE